MTLTLLLLVATLLPSACSTDECLDNQNSLPLAGFYSATLPDQAVRISNLTIFGVDQPGDSLLLDRSSASEVYLPFRIDQPETSYIFIYEDSGSEDTDAQPLADQITFRYEIEPWFVSSACGAIYKYKVTEILSTHVMIESVECPTGIITNKPTQNLKIYFKTDSE